jgi:hypothetical protein
VLPVLRMTTMSWQVWLGCVSVIERRGVGGGGAAGVENDGSELAGLAR